MTRPQQPTVFDVWGFKESGDRVLIIGAVKDAELHPSGEFVAYTLPAGMAGEERGYLRLLEKFVQVVIQPQS